MTFIFVSGGQSKCFWYTSYDKTLRVPNTRSDNSRNELIKAKSRPVPNLADKADGSAGLPECSSVLRSRAFEYPKYR